VELPQQTILQQIQDVLIVRLQHYKNIFTNQKFKIMKKNFKKLALNKKEVSNLSVKLKGGLRRQDDTSDTFTTGPTGPTAQTHCFICPAER
jgi:hypothetical protein